MWAIRVVVGILTFITVEGNLRMNFNTRVGQWDNFVIFAFIRLSCFLPCLYLWTVSGIGHWQSNKICFSCRTFYYWWHDENGLNLFLWGCQKLVQNTNTFWEDDMGQDSIMFCTSLFSHNIALGTEKTWYSRGPFCFDLSYPKEVMPPPCCIAQLNPCKKKMVAECQGKWTTN